MLAPRRPLQYEITTRRVDSGSEVNMTNEQPGRIAELAPVVKPEARKKGVSLPELESHAMAGTQRPSAFQAPRVALNYEPELGAESLDRMSRASLANLTAGISPVGLSRAYVDWISNLALSPGKRMVLGINAMRQAWRLWLYSGFVAAGVAREPVIEPQSHDKRFSDESWRVFPYSVYQQAFLLAQQWWHNATSGVRGVSKHDQDVVSFVARQLLDVWSPSNLLATNPVVQKATLQEGGANIVRGWVNFLQRFEKQLGQGPDSEERNFRPGSEVAVTPGKVVYRNRLIELIQYAPLGEQVFPEPLLIVPAWIMKYYILDLSPENSLVRYLVSKGHTVFTISWCNPEAEDRDLDMEDYRRLGVMAAVDAISTVVPERKIHTLGYCLGGTLLAIAAAAMARSGDHRLASMTLLAAQTDFTEAGELLLFVDSNELSFLDDMMWNQGFLRSDQMAGAFTMLRSADLFWSRMLHEYLLGRRTGQNDLMAWNADSTRLPYHMHSQYLHQLFLENRLARGQFEVEGRPVALADIKIPLFVVATSKDHVAPWKSVYKIRLLTDTDMTFLLTSGGHNAGIVTPPGHPRRIYQIGRIKDHHRYTDPDSWQEETPVHQGSWWPEFETWLDHHSGRPNRLPPMGAPDQGYTPLCEAPGTYVLQT
jgi:polyhydroxyalkanoate synthase